MRRQLYAVLIALVGVSLPMAWAAAQGTHQPGHGGMMGMRHDSATMAEMHVVHQLLANHERITRTVTNLPDGIRTLTESDDPAVAQLIRDHVATMLQRVREGRDPGLPMESPALQSIFRDKDKIRTTVEITAKGVIVVQTSTDALAVAALQQHASEVSDLTRGGMGAMHEVMMKHGGMMAGGMMHGMMAGGMMHGMMQGGMMHGMMQGGAGSDSAFTALQMRGRQAMGVDQNTSTHKFDSLVDGGRIELQRNVDDPVGVEQIRRHLQEIAKAFKSGDFTTPAFVHMRQVPGTEILAARRDAITYTYRDLPRGGELRMVTRDPEALEAIHAFLAFQRQDHRAGGIDHVKKHQRLP